MIIQKKAPAKINLYLKILDRLPNGYHNIFTVMQKISLCDYIKLNINPGSGQNINIICDNKNIPADKSNTAFKAAQMFFDRAKISGVDLIIEITKKIPSQAGLGGGSSDAAAVLLGLNEYYNFVLDENILLDIALKIGADVPFFVRIANCAVCEGIGEIVTPCDIDLSGLHCLIVKPVYNVSTKQAYEDWDAYCRERINAFREPAKTKTDVITIFSERINPFPTQSDNVVRNIHNDFAGLIFSRNKNIEEIKNLLIKSGASAAELSGSGSALFGIFDDFDDALRCKNKINLRNDIEFCDIFDFLS